MLKADARKLARTLIHENNLEGWGFTFDRAVRRFGCCHSGRHFISLSEPLTDLNPEPIVRDVILHEIAHALAGHSAGHGEIWKHYCRKIGAKPERCYNSATVKTPPRKINVIGTCPNCGHQTCRYRRINGLACGKCCKQFNNDKWSQDYEFKWKAIK